MNFRNILWTYAPKKDGSCDIKIYFSEGGRKKYVSTGIKLLPEYWDSKKEIVKNNHPLHKRYNAKIARTRLDIERHFLDGRGWDSLFREDPNEKSLADVLSQIISEGKEGSVSLSKSTLKGYKSTLKRVLQHEDYSQQKTPTLAKVSMDFYHSFTSFLATQCNCQLPGIDSHIKIIKRIMNIGIERKLHNNTIHLQKGFRRHRSSATEKIFLNESEIQKLERLDLSHMPHLERERDRWLVAYYFLLRFSDAKRINRDNIRIMSDRQFFQYNSQKTGKQATIPVRSKAHTLLKKYNYSFAWGDNQQANRKIKIIGAYAGIQEPIRISKSTVPKHSLITTHTARRSAATNLYLSGQFSLKTIADLGGWEDVKVLQIYLRCSNLDSARMAAKNSYFD